VDLGFIDWVCVVIGVSCGIGWVIVWMLVVESVLVLLVVWGVEGFVEVEEECCGVVCDGIWVEVLVFDVIDFNVGIGIVVECEWYFGCLDVFVNNVGIV